MLLAIGGLAGIVSAFLPLMFVSVEVKGPGGANPFAMLPGQGGGSPGEVVIHNMTVQVEQSWQGMLSLLGYLAALIGAFVLYPPQGSAKRALVWAGLGAGLLVAVLALWLLLLALGMGKSDLMGMGRVAVTPGVGAFVNAVAAALVAAGCLLKAREEKLL
jgi:hypothetical protein